MSGDKCGSQSDDTIHVQGAKDAWWRQTHPCRHVWRMTGSLDCLKVETEQL